ncbi:hypothetical protein HLB23_24520 [Nocardia uniformis]|uniref:Uncharacterized protein n=1 Tax=Nocardia uniformis TaxID=53432 RepID=A0A849C5M4_9NOCA|nr:hypothetical protein [Nocardia uniformis]NNH72986.1 hypothetical protein [Nocardia uniformis]
MNTIYALLTIDVSAIEPITSEAPPGSNAVIRLVRWLLWGVMLSGVAGITYAGGKFAWERWTGGVLESPKMVVAALIGGIVATSASTILNTVVLTT